MKIIKCYCEDCMEEFELKSDNEDVQVCPFCSSANLEVEEPVEQD